MMGNAVLGFFSPKCITNEGKLSGTQLSDDEISISTEAVIFQTHFVVILNKEHIDGFFMIKKIGTDQHCFRTVTYWSAYNAEV